VFRSLSGRCCGVCVCVCVQWVDGRIVNVGIDEWMDGQIYFIRSRCLDEVILTVFRAVCMKLSYMAIIFVDIWLGKVKFPLCLSSTP
jgi:hypothetical protein